MTRLSSRICFCIHSTFVAPKIDTNCEQINFVKSGLYWPCVHQNSTSWPAKDPTTMSNVQLYKSRIFVGTWHMIAFVQFLYAIYFDWNFVQVPADIELKMVQPGIGGRTRFLTYWCLVSRWINRWWVGAWEEHLLGVLTYRLRLPFVRNYFWLPQFHRRSSPGGLIIYSDPSPVVSGILQRFICQINRGVIYLLAGLKNVCGFGDQN